MTNSTCDAGAGPTTENRWTGNPRIFECDSEGIHYWIEIRRRSDGGLWFRQSIKPPSEKTATNSPEVIWDAMLDREYPADYPKFTQEEFEQHPDLVGPIWTEVKE